MVVSENNLWADKAIIADMYTIPNINAVLDSCVIAYKGLTSYITALSDHTVTADSCAFNKGRAYGEYGKANGLPNNL